MSAMTNSQRASYIRGLMDGLELDPADKNTKIFNAMVELLEDLSTSVEELEDQYDAFSQQLDEVDEDLGTLEAEYYGLDEDDCGCGCGCHHHDGADPEFGVTCPSCGDTIELTDDLLAEGSIVCPGCGETLEFDLDEEEDEDEEAPSEDK